MIESSNFIAIAPGATINYQWKLAIIEVTLLEFSERIDFSEEFALWLLEGQVELIHAVALKLGRVRNSDYIWNNLRSANREQLI